MSFHFNAYEHTVIRHEELIAEAEIERQLQKARAARPGVVTRLRIALGQWLIQAGESLTQAGGAPGSVQRSSRA